MGQWWPSGLKYDGGQRPYQPPTPILHPRQGPPWLWGALTLIFWKLLCPWSMEAWELADLWPQRVWLPAFLGRRAALGYFGIATNFTLLLRELHHSGT